MKQTTLFIVTVLVFTGLGVAIAKAQFNYENSTAKGSTVVFNEDAVDKQRHMMITYGIAGAALGLVMSSLGTIQRQLKSTTNQ
jgi:uncharacterized membrane protein YbjE (DUF340 family)